MSDELKLVPCPFCGNQAKVVEMDDYFMAMCECGANYEGPSAEDCAEAWNRRATPSPSTAPIAEDERANFEAHLRSEVQKDSGITDCEEYVALLLQRAPNGDYSTTWVHAGWEYWQARAALASKPTAREAARQSIAYDPEFVILVKRIMAASERIDSYHGQRLIAHIDTWGARRDGEVVPAILFDGKAVYDEVLCRSSRTSAENVADVLDAVVRLIRRGAAPDAGNTAQLEK